MGRTIRYGPKRCPPENRNGRSAGSPVAVGASERVTPSDDQSAAKSVSCDGPSPGLSGFMGPPSGEPHFTRTGLKPQDLADDGDLARVIRVVLDDAVQQLVVADPRAERTVARIVGRLHELIVAHPADDLHQLVMRGVERVERGLPARGRGVADLGPVAVRRFAGRRSGRAPLGLSLIHI